MKSRCGLIFALAWAVLPTLRSQPAAPAAAHPLVWDAMEKSYASQLGDPAANLAFAVTNASDRPVTITEIKTSCGCTTVDTPKLPWTLPPGARGAMNVKVDLVDKFGAMTKTVRVTSAPGQQDLKVHIVVPLPMAPAERRRRTAAIMATDRQAIFRRDDCVACHAHPAAFKHGEALFAAACAICHQGPNRAELVPDLAVAHGHRDAAFWRELTTKGREHTLMPGFAQSQGGPLNEEQIDSLVAYLVKTFPSDPSL